MILTKANFSLLLGHEDVRISERVLNKGRCLYIHFEKKERKKKEDRLHMHWLELITVGEFLRFTLVLRKKNKYSFQLFWVTIGKHL